MIELVLFFAYILTGVLDAHSTYLGISKHGLEEVNPVMRWAADKFGLTGALVLKVALTIALAAWLFWEGWFVVLLFLAVLTFVIAINNYRLISKE